MRVQVCVCVCMWVCVRPCVCVWGGGCMCAAQCFRLQVCLSVTSHSTLLFDCFVLRSYQSPQPSGSIALGSQRSKTCQNRSAVLFIFPSNFFSAIFTKRLAHMALFTWCKHWRNTTENSNLACQTYVRRDHFKLVCKLILSG